MIKYPEGVKDGLHGELIKKGNQGLLVKSGKWKNRLVLLSDSEMFVYRPKVIFN
jgi:hypothetical protein